MKAILMSIRPEWVAKILNGEKTIEIRKSAPKCDLPIDVYIYCTKGDGLQKLGNKYFALAGSYPVRNDKVLAKFTLRKVEKAVKKTIFNEEICYAWHISDLVIFDEPKTLSEFRKVGWDKGLEEALDEARKRDAKIAQRICDGDADEDEIDNWEELTTIGFKFAGRIKRAPQSWRYVEVLLL